MNVGSVAGKEFRHPRREPRKGHTYQDEAKRTDVPVPGIVSILIDLFYNTVIINHTLPTPSTTKLMPSDAMPIASDSNTRNIMVKTKLLYSTNRTDAEIDVTIHCSVVVAHVIRG
jgi:hypothetical protein